MRDPCCYLPIGLLLALLCSPAALAADGKIGIIGDSMSAGTHSLDTCDSYDIVRCLEERGGLHDRDWSHAGGVESWSIASRLGFDAAHVVDASGDGEEWKDALEQAEQVTADGAVNSVFINLGANDICQARGHDYGPDLPVIAGHIDDTLQVLTGRLPAGSTIFWTGVLDVSRLYDALRARDHNLLFESCQATWDLDNNKIKPDAVTDACDHYFGAAACEVLTREEEAADLVGELFLEILLQSVKVEEGPCGKLLSSRSTAQDRLEVQQFTRDLNALMGDKARQYDGANGVHVVYSDRVFEAAGGLQPEHVSHVDCYHPSRAGQLFLSDAIWRGFNRGTTQANALFAEDFAAPDYCRASQAAWRSCWVEGNDDQQPATGSVRVAEQRLRLQDPDRSLVRALPLGGYDRAWLAFNRQRIDLDNRADYLAVELSADGGRTWQEIDRFQGDGDEFGLHRGDYYDISPFASADTRIRFHSSPDFGSNDRVLIDNVRVLAWQSTATDDRAPDSTGDDFAHLYGYGERALQVLNNDGPGATLVDAMMPAHGSAVADGEVIRYTPQRGFTGLDSFHYRSTAGDGAATRKQVSLQVARNSLERALGERLAREPDFAAELQQLLAVQLRDDPEGEVAQQVRQAVSRQADEDPWFRRRLVAALRAGGATAPVDLYVYIGDDNLQGVTENGNFDDGTRRFERAMENHTDHKVIVMNCALAGSSAAQWSSLDAPAGETFPYLNPPRDTRLAAPCLEAIDGVLAAGNATLRGLVIGLGSSDLLLGTLQGQPALLEDWQRNARRAIDLFRSRYGEDVAVVLLESPPPRSADTPLNRAWQALREQQAGLLTYRIAWVDGDDLPAWDDGSVLPHFSAAAQAQLGERLAQAFRDPPQPVLGATGDCSPQSPCFPGTGYRIEPALCDGGNVFRAGRESGRVLCDQHGNSLHALAAACGDCIDLAAVAADLEVGIVTAVAAPDLLPTYYMPQRLGGERLPPLPYDNPYTSPPAAGCGAQDAESATFVAAPGSYDYRVDALFAEHCETGDRSGCGLLLSPQSALRDSAQVRLQLAAGDCLRLSVGHGGG